MALNINRYGLRTQYLTMILVPVPAVQYKQSYWIKRVPRMPWHSMGFKIIFTYLLAISHQCHDYFKGIWYHYYIQNVSCYNNYTLGPKLWNQLWILKHQGQPHVILFAILSYLESFCHQFDWQVLFTNSANVITCSSTFFHSLDLNHWTTYKMWQKKNCFSIE